MNQLAMSIFKNIIASVVTVQLLLLCQNQIVGAQKTFARNSLQQQHLSSWFNQQPAHDFKKLTSTNRWINSDRLAAQAPRRQTQEQQSYSTRSTRVSFQSPTATIPQQQVSYSKEEPSEEVTSGVTYSLQKSAVDQAELASYGSVRGQPGKDFPAYTRVPKTSFSCSGRPYDYAMYADEETGCQAFHVCYNGRKDSFLCGVGTVFNQRILHCDYWHSVDCGKSSQYWSSNTYLGSSQPEPGPAEAGPPVAPGVYGQQSSQSNFSKRVTSVAARRPTDLQQSTYNNLDNQPLQDY